MKEVEETRVEQRKETMEGHARQGDHSAGVFGIGLCKRAS